MSVLCGLECVVCLGCSRWAWKRLTYTGSYDSESWPPLPSPSSFEPIPRICRTILASYDPNLIPPSPIIKRVGYDQTLGRSPPYLISADHPRREITLALRGLNLSRNTDYKLLLDNRLGMQMFDGGYVHHGLLKAAAFVLDREAETLRRLLGEMGTETSLIFAGHSLGSGVAALITSVVLQDDFLPRTPTPLENIFGCIFCLPCLLFFVCMKDTFIPESRKLKDPRRLYAPGRMYHIVERKFCRCGRFPPEVRTAIPVDGRFEHVVLSCNATSDHGIIWIEREAQKALDLMMESAEPSTPPAQQIMSRKQSLEKEHRDALERAVNLNVPHAISPTEESTAVVLSCSPAENQDDEAVTSTNSSKSSGKDNWDELVEKLFTRSESGNLVLKKDISMTK